MIAISTFLRRGYLPSLWELGTGAIPTWLGYEPYLKDPHVPWKGYVFSGMVLLIILVMLVLRRMTKRNQMVAEALATGYFLALWRPLADNIKFNSGRLGTSGLKVQRILIHIPASEDDLKELQREFNAKRASGEYQQVNVAMPGRNKDVDASLSNGDLIIHDFPNTLNSLRSYMRFESGDDYSNERSKRYHRWFRDRLERLLQMEDGDQVRTEIV